MLHISGPSDLASWGPAARAQVETALAQPVEAPAPAPSAPASGERLLPTPGAPTAAVPIPPRPHPSERRNRRAAGTLGRPFFWALGGGAAVALALGVGAAVAATTPHGPGPTMLQGGLVSGTGAASASSASAPAVVTLPPGPEATFDPPAATAPALSATAPAPTTPPASHTIAADAPTTPATSATGAWPAAPDTGGAAWTIPGCGGSTYCPVPGAPGLLGPVGDLYDPATGQVEAPAQMPAGVHALDCIAANRAPWC